MADPITDAERAEVRQALADATREHDPSGICLSSECSACRADVRIEQQAKRWLAGYEARLTALEGEMAHAQPIAGSGWVGAKLVAERAGGTWLVESATGQRSVVEFNYHQRERAEQAEARLADLERRVRDVTKRGYSRDFTPRTERRVMLTIDRIPPTLLDRAKAKAKREGVSLRALILGWLKAWTETREARWDYESTCAGSPQPSPEPGAVCGEFGTSRRGGWGGTNRPPWKPTRTSGCCG